MAASPANQGKLHHGGDTGAAETRFGCPAEGWLDLSTGIAPFVYPVGDIPAAAWHRLPEPRDAAALAGAAARAYGVESPELIVPAPGSQVFIQRLPDFAAACSRVAVVGPTYGEHARAWRAAGHDVEEVGNLEEGAHADILLVVSPNNPDGRQFDPAALAAFAGNLAARGGFAVVDQAFADVAPEISMAPYVGQPGLVVLRSFGKFFGLAGLRLGFALASRPVAERLRSSIGPWAVSGPAIAIARRALSDFEWITQQRARLAQAARRLRELLQRGGFEIVGGTDLFVLASRSNAPAVFEHLGRHGILVRSFATNASWLRFGLPGAEPEWNRLDATLGSFVSAPRVAAARG